MKKKRASGTIVMRLFLIVILLVSNDLNAQLTLIAHKSINSICDSNACNYIGPSILINEVNISPSTYDGSIYGIGPGFIGDTCQGEWIELYNPDRCEPIDISCYFLGNNSRDQSVDYAGGFELPQGTVVPPRGFVIIRGKHAPPVPNFLLIQNGGNTIEIVVSDPSNVCIGGGYRLWFPNLGGWFAFYDRDGVPQDAITWADSTNSDLDGHPCNPSGLCPFTGILSSYNQIPAYRKTKISTLMPAAGLCYQRLPDGGNWMINNQAVPTYGTCNAACIPAPLVSCIGNGEISVAVSGGTPPYSYLWSDALGQTNDTAFQLCEGYYCVTVTDALGMHAVLCDSVFNFRPNVSFVASLPTLCENANPFILSGGSPANGTYSGAGVTNTIFNPLAAGGGTHFITYSVSSAHGCMNADSLPVTVLPMPHIITPNVPPQCLNSNLVDLSSTSPAGGTFSGIGIQGLVFYPILAGLGTFELIYSCTSTNGCSAKDTLTITVNPLPLLSSTPIDTICLTEEPFALNNCTPEGGSYFVNGFPYGSFQASLFGLGSHSVMYIYQIPSTGCSDTITFNINVKAPPTVSVTANPTIVCTGDYVNLKAYGATYYNWSDGNGWGNWHVVNPLITTVYTVTGYNIPGCWDTASVLVEVFQKPYLDLGPDIYELFGAQLILEGPVGPYRYTWSDGSHLRYLTVDSSGLYSLKIEADYYPNGGWLICKDIDTVMVDLLGCVYVPNAFSPDNNGINDVFYAKCGFELAQYSMAIYNRWGNEVFYSEDVNEGWDGTCKGKMSPPDIYVCVVKFKPPHGQVCNTNLIKKAIRLIR